jgi:hypothetical protein
VLAAGALAVAWHAERARPIAPAAPAVAVPEAPIDRSSAIARWRALAPTGADYPDRLASIPPSPAIRRGMAIALLAGANLRCDDVALDLACGEYVGEIAAPRPDAGFDDPCLRRHLAVWALGELAPEDTRGLADTLAAIVEMGAPRAVDDPEVEARLAAETMLPEAVFDAEIDDDLRLELLAIADPELASRRVVDLETRAARRAALRDLHLDAALDALDAVDDRDVRVAALADPDLDVETRLALIDELAGDGGADVTAALRDAAGAEDCRLAYQAARALATRGDRSALPTRPRSTDPDEHLRALCLLAHDDDRDAAFGAWIPARGVDLVEHDDFDPEVVRRERVRRDEVSYPALLDEGVWECTGLTCTGSSDRGTLTVDFARARGSLEVRRIETITYSGCGC